MGMSLWGFSPPSETGIPKDISIPNENSDWQSTRRRQLRWSAPGWESCSYHRPQAGRSRSQAASEKKKRGSQPLSRSPTSLPTKGKSNVPALVAVGLRAFFKLGARQKGTGLDLSIRQSVLAARAARRWAVTQNNNAVPSPFVSNCERRAKAKGNSPKPTAEKNPRLLPPPKVRTT
jgi:hypothetical protein